MEFGRVPAADLGRIDFTLPPGGVMHTTIGQPTDRSVKIYIGCTQWGRKEWIGKIYPRGMKDTAALDHYVSNFNAIELNATHYQVYGPEVIGRWAAKARADDFRFCPKVPQAISHYSGFRNADALTTAFLAGILAFEDKLGPVFMQLSEQYSPQASDHLFRYLRAWPADLPFFLEVRHRDWFADPGANTALFDTLRNLNMGAVITDTAGRRDCAHMTLTVPKAFIRYVGNSMHASDDSRMKAWALRIREWIAEGLQELYFFVHTPDEAYAPEMVNEMIKLLNTTCGLQLRPPRLIQTSLF